MQESHTSMPPSFSLRLPYIYSIHHLYQKEEEAKKWNSYTFTYGRTTEAPATEATTSNEYMNEIWIRKWNTLGRINGSFHWAYTAYYRWCYDFFIFFFLLFLWLFDSEINPGLTIDKNTKIEKKLLIDHIDKSRIHPSSWLSIYKCI